MIFFIKKKYLVLRNQLGGAYTATFNELNATILVNENNLKSKENPDDAITLNKIKLLKDIKTFNKALNNNFSISKDISKIEKSIENLKVQINNYNDVYEPKLSVPEFLNKNIDEIKNLINENNLKNQKLSKQNLL